jgi:hypothetical protein
VNKNFIIILEKTMSANWIDYKGKKIIYIDYMGMNKDHMTEMIKKATQMILDAKSEEVLSLSNVTDCFFDKELLEVIKNQGAISLPHCKKAAVVGVTGIRSVLLSAANAFWPKARKPFDTVEEAKDWLVA